MVNIHHVVVKELADGDKKEKGLPQRNARPSKNEIKKHLKLQVLIVKKQEKKMTRQKRRAERKSNKQGKGNTPTYTSIDERRIISLVFNNENNKN